MIEELSYQDVYIKDSIPQVNSRQEVKLTSNYSFPYSKKVLELNPALFIANMDGVGVFPVHNIMKKYCGVTVLRKHYSVEEIVEGFQEEDDFKYAWVSTGLRKGDKDKMRELEKVFGDRINICLDSPACTPKFFDRLH